MVAFLKRFKAKANEDGGVYFIPRTKNLEGMAQLGLLIGDAEAVILGLTETGYYKGPQYDDNESDGEVWEFGADVDGKPVYIKLKLDTLAAKCLSFHAPEFPLRFPLK